MANLTDFLQHFIHHSETAELNLDKVQATDPVSKLGLRIDCDRTGIRGPQTAHSLHFRCSVCIPAPVKSREPTLGLEASPSQ